MKTKLTKKQQAQLKQDAAEITKQGEHVALGLQVNRAIAKQYLMDLSKFYEIAATRVWDLDEDSFHDDIDQIVMSCGCTLYGLLNVADDFEEIRRDWKNYKPQSKTVSEKEGK